MNTPSHSNRKRKRLSISPSNCSPPNILRNSPWCPLYSPYRGLLSPPPPKRVRIATPMTPLNIWDAPLSPNRKLKKSFIRSSISKNEIKHILEEMKCDPADDYEQCVENLIH